jgi:pyruvate formate lyase activating enzyme
VSTGVIFDIKEFAIYDGPGIRQTVFLKGCPLRCGWCHNPEGLDPAPELLVNMKTGIPRVFGEVLSAAELAGRIRRNADYYSSCGGGVTFSGGEPLMQPAFLSETLSLLDDIHKTIETSGFSDPGTFRDIVRLADLVIMDVKTTDSSKHAKYTGQDNECILANLEYLCRSGISFIIRIPVIPGVNDDAGKKTPIMPLPVKIPIIPLPGKISMMLFPVKNLRPPPPAGILSICFPYSIPLKVWRPGTGEKQRKQAT